MSPWPMMNEWGIPTFYLESLAYQFCDKLTRRGIRVPDIAMAGGFSTEDGVFKAMAMGSPPVCQGSVPGQGPNDTSPGGEKHREVAGR